MNPKFIISIALLALLAVAHAKPAEGDDSKPPAGKDDDKPADGPEGDKPEGEDEESKTGIEAVLGVITDFLPKIAKSLVPPNPIKLVKTLEDLLKAIGGALGFDE